MYTVTYLPTTVLFSVTLCVPYPRACAMGWKSVGLNNLQDSNWFPTATVNVLVSKPETYQVLPDQLSCFRSSSNWTIYKITKWATKDQSVFNFNGHGDYNKRNTSIKKKIYCPGITSGMNVANESHMKISRSKNFTQVAPILIINKWVKCKQWWSFNVLRPIKHKNLKYVSNFNFLIINH